MNAPVEAPNDILYTLMPAPGGAWYAARQSGLYRSQEGGQTWRPLYESLNLEAPLATVALALSPAFAADHTLVAGVHGGVMISRDEGETWHVTRFPDPPSTTAALVLSPDFARDGVIVAGTTEDGIYRSDDGGESWRAWNFGLLDRRVLCLSISPNFAHDPIVLAGTESGLCRSDNGGRSWRDVQLPAADIPVFRLAVLANDVILAGTESSGLLRSVDAGQTWAQTIQTDVPVNDLQAAPPHLVALVGGEIWISHDDGAAWSVLPGIEEAIAIAVPDGLNPGRPLWMGLEDGSVIQRQIP